VALLRQRLEATLGTGLALADVAPAEAVNHETN
jgi:hypothetical protein